MTSRTTFALIAGLLICGPALAHKPSDSYLRIAAGDARLTAEWDIALKDLEMLIGLDADGDGQVTWGEVRSKQSAIVSHALSRLAITADGQPCELIAGNLLISDHSDGPYAVLDIQTNQSGGVAEIGINYALLFDRDPTHRGLVMVSGPQGQSTHVLSPESPTLAVTLGETDLFATFAEYVREGVWHIWIGTDHILFLLALLLPAVFRREEGEWRPVESFRPAWFAVLKIVTVFTVAHSITLWLAVMEYVELPSQWVEATIALSIVVTAINNLRPTLPVSNWAIAFAFGLIHGFGFASVLIDLGLSDFALGLSLLGFNVGVELGQLAIVAAFFPVAYLMRRSWFYRWPVFAAGSVAVSLVACVWVYERVFNAEVLGI